MTKRNEKWKRELREYYNPGGATYREVWVDDEVNEHGFADEWVQQIRDDGSSIWVLMPIREERP